MQRLDRAERARSGVERMLGRHFERGARNLDDGVFVDLARDDASHGGARDLLVGGKCEKLVAGPHVTDARARPVGAEDGRVGEKAALVVQDEIARNERPAGRDEEVIRGTRGPGSRDGGKQSIARSSVLNDANGVARAQERRHAEDAGGDRDGMLGRDAQHPAVRAKLDIFLRLDGDARRNRRGSKAQPLKRHHRIARRKPLDRRRSLRRQDGRPRFDTSAAPARPGSPGCEERKRRQG